VHHSPFAQGRIFAVLCQGYADHAGVLKGSAHQAIVLNTSAIVGEDAHTEGGHLIHRCQQFTFTSDGNRSSYVHIDQPGLDTKLQYLVDHGGGVNRRVGVGHGENGRVATQCCGTRSRLDGFCCFVTGFAKVCVQINQSGANDAAGSIEFHCTRGPIY
jgi:hypothetical protein